MKLKPLALLLAMIFAAGCTLQTADVSRQSGSDAWAYETAPNRVITVTSGNIDQFAVQSADVYLVGRGDVLQIHAIDAPELTTPAGYLVEQDGAIQVPFLGRVAAAERDAMSIRNEIERRLRRYLPDPQVELRIIEHNARHVSVIGDVNRPTRQALTSQPLSVIDAINAAGGFAPRANMRGVSILRSGQQIAVDMEGFLNHGRSLPTLRDGDVLQVARPARGTSALAPTGVRMQVAGQAARVFDLGHRPVTLAQLLKNAGAHGQNAQVMRGHTAFLFDAQDATNPAVGGQFKLENGDRVTVQGALSAHRSAQH